VRKYRGEEIATVTGALPAAQDPTWTWRFRPYWYYQDLPEDRLARYFRLQVRQTDRRSGVRTWTLRRAGRNLGLAQLEPLEWDSRMLRRQAGRLNWLIASGGPGGYWALLSRKQRLLDGVLAEADRLGITYLTARVAAGDYSSIHALESRGFLALDTIVTFSRSAGSAPPAGPGWRVRPAGPGDLRELRRIAASSFFYDRYHSDPVLPGSCANRLHGEWAVNSARGFADAVLAAESPHGIAGFTTVKIDHQTKKLLGVSIAAIVLVAVAQEARGQGAGQALTQASLEWCSRQGVDRVEVGTQVRNAPACRLYARAGFHMVGASMSFRYDSSQRR
jgi:ribosomal protein S18 acetylase RimI-like enzyme